MKASRERMLAELGKIIVGQAAVIEQVLLTLFVGGNSLIVGVPGLAKTLLIHTLADVLDLKFSRIQFTPDLMPSDITGTDIIQDDPQTGKRHMVFAPGPVFTNILLADEINRTPPKTQSALLEAMQEHRVTIQGRTYTLDEPFYVFATQNPIELEGTYPLPEAQLDRFMFHIVIDHPPEDEELEVLRSTTAIQDAQVERAVTGAELLAFQRLVRRVPVAEPVMRYALNLVRVEPASRPARHAGLRREVGGVRRQRARGAVPGARRQGAGAHARPLPRGVRGRPGAGAPGAAPPRAHQLPRRVGRRDDRPDHRPAAGGRAGAEVGDVAMERRDTRVSMRGARFVDPSALARIRNLELLARTVVDGFINGLHRAPHLGFSLDFAEHRGYVPGDDLRRVDWRVFARTDRYYVKQFEADSNANLVVALDVSRRCATASGGVTQARLRPLPGRVAAVLLAPAARPRRPGHLRRGDRRVRAAVGAAPRVRALRARPVAEGRPGGLAAPLLRLTERLVRRGIVVVISDLYDEPDAIANAVRPLRYRGHDVIVFHVLDPAEIDFPFTEAASFEDLETGERMPIVPASLREQYQALVRQHTRGARPALHRQPDRLRAVQHLGAARPRAVPLPVGARAPEPGPLMTFLAPALLAGLLAIAIPIVVHLVQRERAHDRRRFRR